MLLVLARKSLMMLFSFSAYAVRRSSMIGETWSCFFPKLANIAANSFWVISSTLCSSRRMLFVKNFTFKSRYPG